MLTLRALTQAINNIAMEPVDLVKLLNEVCDKIRPLADAQRQTLTTQVDSQDPVEVMADDSSLSRLFWILIDTP